MAPLPTHFTFFIPISWQFLISWQSLCTSTSHQITYFWFGMSEISKISWENGLNGVNVLVRGAIFSLHPVQIQLRTMKFHRCPYANSVLLATEHKGGPKSNLAIWVFLDQDIEVSSKGKKASFCIWQILEICANIAST